MMSIVSILHWYMDVEEMQRLERELVWLWVNLVKEKKFIF
jgi:hypothetical protein